MDKGLNVGLLKLTLVDERVEVQLLATFECLPALLAGEGMACV